MNDRLVSPLLRFVMPAACLVIIMWGMRVASDLLVPVFVGVAGAYALLPLPKWLMKRFNFRRRSAMVLMAASLGTFSLLLVVALYWRSLRMLERLPVYREHVLALYANLEVTLQGHGINMPDLSHLQSSRSELIVEFGRWILPQLASFLALGVLISVLGCIFLIMMLEQAGGKRNSLAEALAYYGADTQRYIVAMTKSGAIAALGNLVLLASLGVEVPLLWCVLYFFLQFIPSVGFIISVVPPTFLALIMMGWKTALLVCGGFIVIDCVNGYVLTPIFMKKGVHVSFLAMLVSLMFWGFLLGLAGGILAVPLTLALRKVIERIGERPLTGQL